MDLKLPKMLINSVFLLLMSGVIIFVSDALLYYILLSVLFSAGVFVRYAYPIMSGAPLLLALALFERRD